MHIKEQEFTIKEVVLFRKGTPIPVNHFFLKSKTSQFNQ
jgi:hypothetical protein